MKAVSMKCVGLILIFFSIASISYANIAFTKGIVEIWEHGDIPTTPMVKESQTLRLLASQEFIQIKYK